MNTSMDRYVVYVLTTKAITYIYIIFCITRYYILHVVTATTGIPAGPAWYSRASVVYRWYLNAEVVPAEISTACDFK